MGSTSKTDLLTTESFTAALNALIPQARQTAFLVAYSGGVDSHALLHLCVEAGLCVRAVHVHHGLQQQADDWAEHCQSVCEALGVELQLHYVDARAEQGESPEAAARAARYAALDDALRANEILLLAQHKTDQAETVMLQLLRGAGAAGLSAMPACSQTASGHRMLRPLLHFERQQIEHYAKRHHLQWVHDPSNEDTRYRRNALRQQVMPAIRQHWPQAADALARVAKQQQTQRDCLDELAQIDLANSIARQPEQLRLLCLNKLSANRQFNLLRYWLHHLQTRPNRHCIEQIISNVIQAADDAVPSVRWDSYEVRRFNNALYLLPQSATQALTDVIEWQPAQPVTLPSLNMQIVAVENVYGGLKPELLQHALQIRFRSGGERIKPQGCAHHQSLKKLLQQAVVPPWQRQRIPLLYHGDELIAVCGHWLAAEHCVEAGQQGWSPQLTPCSDDC